MMNVLFFLMWICLFIMFFIKKDTPAEEIREKRWRGGFRGYRGYGIYGGFRGFRGHGFYGGYRGYGGYGGYYGRSFPVYGYYGKREVGEVTPEIQSDRTKKSEFEPVKRSVEETMPTIRGCNL